MAAEEDVTFTLRIVINRAASSHAACRVGIGGLKRNDAMKVHGGAEGGDIREATRGKVGKCKNSIEASNVATEGDGEGAMRTTKPGSQCSSISQGRGGLPRCNVASTAPLDTELKATACRHTLINYAVNGIFRVRASSERPGIIIRVSRLMDVINDIANAAANRQAESNTQGLGCRPRENSEAWKDKKREVANSKGTGAADRSYVKGQGESERVLRMGQGGPFFLPMKEVAMLSEPWFYAWVEAG